jgi:myo-inositol-1(or 4)-monophosphatase
MSGELLEVAREAARAGAGVLRRYFRAGGLRVESKGEHDYVTQADRESEAAVVAILGRRFPDHRIVGEESGLVAAGAGAPGEYQWLIDPLDGTTNFLHGLPIFAISIACRRGRDLLAAVVHDPIADVWFTAARGEGAFRDSERLRVSARPGLAGAFLATGFPFRARRALDAYMAVFREAFQEARAIRRCGAAALDLAHTAAGVYDGFFEFRLSPWDVAAGALLVTEAGGALCDLDGGDRFLVSGNVLAGGLGVLAGLRTAVAPHASEALVEQLVPADLEVAGWVSAS